MKFGTKKAAKAIFGAVKKAGSAIGDAGEAVADAVDPAKHAARAIDKAVDTFKDDEFVVEGESHLTLFGVAVGSLKHRLRATVADKE